MIVIGITGRARAGKNTVAEGLISGALNKSLSVRTYEISDYVLKDLISKGMLPKGTERKDLTETGLKLMVCHGLDCRDQAPYYWINKVLSDINRDKPEVAILPNIRFLNEADAVRKSDPPGFIIRVQSLVRDGVEYISTDRDPNDLMETEQKKIDADFFLTATRGRTILLRMQAENLFEYILKETKN